MLLSELNLRALNVSASSSLPMSITLNVEGNEVAFQITAFQSGFGSGKKSVVSGSIHADNGTKKIENADVEAIRRALAKLLGLKPNKCKTRVKNELNEVDELRRLLSVARRLPRWCKIDAEMLRANFKAARNMDRENARKALQARAVTPILARVAKLSPEERALLLASLQ